MPATAASNQAAVTPDFFRALGDATRLRLMSALTNSGSHNCVCELVYGMQIPQYRISKHLAVLSRAGLVKASHRGTWVRYALTSALPPQLQECLQELAAQEPYASDLARIRNRMLLRNEQGLCAVGFAPEEEIEAKIAEAKGKNARCCGS